MFISLNFKPWPFEKKHLFEYLELFWRFVRTRISQLSFYNQCNLRGFKNNDNHQPLILIINLCHFSFLCMAQNKQLRTSNLTYFLFNILTLKYILLALREYGLWIMLKFRIFTIWISWKHLIQKNSYSTITFFTMPSSGQLGGQWHCVYTI